MSTQTLLTGRVRILLFLLQRASLPVLLLLFSTAGYAQAKDSPQRKQISISLTNAPLENAFALIRQQTPYRFVYDNELLKKAKPVTVHAENSSLDGVLSLLFKSQPFDYRIMETNIIITPKASFQIFKDDEPAANKQDTVVTGIVVADSTLVPLAHATINIKGTPVTAATDESGRFSIALPAEGAKLIISYVGYVTQTIPVNSNMNLPITIKLKEAPHELSEVTIVSNGYQDIPKERIVGAVSFVDNKTLNQQTGTNVLQRLNNVTSGLLFNINKQDRKGDPNNISIRGLSTINGPVAPLVVLDNFIYEGDINNINPNDVDNITVLKDAAATSIWGARAGNGVIVITTKKGKYNQKLNIDFNADVIITEKPDLYYPSRISVNDYINVEEFIFNKGYFDYTINDIYQRFPLTPAAEVFLHRRDGLITAQDSATQIDALKKTDSRDQYNKYFYQTAITQQYSLQLSGGGNNIAWLIAGNIDKNAGSLKNEFNKVNIRFNNTYTPFKHFELNLGAYYTSSKAVSGLQTGFPINGRTVPYLQFADENGSPLAIDRYRKDYIDTAGGGYLLNWNFYPLDDYKHDATTITQQEIVANIGLGYQFLKGFVLTLNYQYQKQTTNSERQYDIQSFYTRDLINTFSQLDYTAGTVDYIIPEGGILSNYNTNLYSQNFRGQLNYNHNWKNHSVSALMGSEIRESVSDGDSWSIYGYNKDPLSQGEVDYRNYYPTFISGGYRGIPNPPFTSPTNTYRFASFFANASYIFKSRYILYGSVRKDASNVFGLSTNDKWNPLWSAGAGWNISRESFYNLSWLSYLKLRISYGYSGNVDVTKSPLPVSGSGYTDFITNFPIETISNPNNPLLKWEKAGQINLGIEFSASGDILAGSIDYYQKKGSDLYGVTAFDYTAFPLSTQVEKNVADMKGNGIEVLLKSKNIDKTFKWNTSFLFNYTSNKTTAYFSTGANSIYYLVASDRMITPVVGYPLYSIAAYKWGGLNAAGDPQGYLNGKLSTDYNAITSQTDTKGGDSSGIVYLGPSSPKYFGSVINELRWKGFFVSFNISYSLGYYFRKTSFTSDALINNGFSTADFEKRWQQPGDELKTNIPAFEYIDYPQFYSRDNFYASSAVNVLKADNIRLQYINVGYMLDGPQKRLPVKQVQIYFNAANLGIIWRANKNQLDPDYPNALPPQKTWTIGIRASF
ncbi:MAG TPA: SusC/RagA family TonB-linked outer membrane protein [Parafilimonas sp.]|nr:SusC/RagA family TonB-linked outer membrane protein [Parafilimonas sp.]